MSSKISLALCIWKIGKVLTNENSYIILSFTTEGELQLRSPNLKDMVSSTREAIYKLFGFNDPPKLSGQIPRPSLKQFLRNLNPIDFFNPNYIPSSAIMPKNNDDIYLCIEVIPDQLKLGLITDTFQTGTFILESNKENIESYLEFFGTACVQFICSGKIQKEIKDTLKRLLSSLSDSFTNIQNN